MSKLSFTSLLIPVPLILIFMKLIKAVNLLSFLDFLKSLYFIYLTDKDAQIFAS